VGGKYIYPTEEGAERGCFTNIRLWPKKKNKSLSVLDVIWFLGPVSVPPTHPGTSHPNRLSGVGCTLVPPPPSTSNWILRIKKHPYILLRTQAPSLPKGVLTPAIGIECNSKVFLNKSFKTQNVPAPKTTRFLFWGRRMPFKAKGVPSKFLCWERRWWNRLGVRTFLADFLRRVSHLLNKSGQRGVVYQGRVPAPHLKRWRGLK
jgi:hypothetical protein